MNCSRLLRCASSRRQAVFALFVFLCLRPGFAQADFGIQVGAFATRGNAERLVTRLNAVGFENVTLWNITHPTRTLVSVLVGPYAEWQQAERVNAVLSAKGWRGFIRAYPAALLTPTQTPVSGPGSETTPEVQRGAVGVDTPPEFLPSETKDTRFEWSGYVALEFRSFFNDPLDPRQHGDNFSLAAEPELYYEWNGGRDSISFVPFFRLDEHDDERSHADIRELTWLTARDGWELRLGNRKVFWGVTESQHLVDIINQTDLVENIDGEDKLGQPMVNLAFIQDWGTVDLFVLPYFRERTFPGAKGRPRVSPRVEPDGTLFESSREEQHIDLAARWSHSIEDWDLGLSHFSGTSRDPRFTLGTLDGGETVLFPIYDLIDQTGADIQVTKESWLWKAEAIRRSGQVDTFFASTAGFEYTFYGVLENAADLGVLVEYLYGNHPRVLSAPFTDDIFTGLRLTLNDVQSTEALVGCIFDVDTSARFCNVEASRRFGDRWVLGMEVRTFNDIPEEDPLYSLRRDDYAQLELAYHF